MCKKVPCSLPLLFAIALFFALAPGVSAATYYIAANGSDSNSGTSKSAPWRHAPGMTNCSGVCASTTPLPGDRIVFRGGDTWHQADFYFWRPSYSGNAANHIYIGVDKTWYTGAAWTRPILNGDNIDHSSLAPFIMFDANYIDFDNFEFTGLYQGGQCGFGFCQYLNYGSVSTYITVQNSYFHGWSHAPYPAANDNIVVVGGDSHSPTQNVGCIFAYNVIDGSDSTNGGDSGAAVFHGPAIVHHNYIRNVSNGLETQGTDTHDNTIGPVNNSFDPNQHENGILQLGGAPPGTGEFYYNNLLYSTTAVNYWVVPVGTQYNFNNVMYNTDNGNVFNVGPGSGGGVGGIMYGFNNTVECGRDSDPQAACLTGSQLGTAGLISNNEHFITTGDALICYNDDPCSTGPNDVKQDKATANRQGYTLANQFRPTSGSGSTVGTGANLMDVYCTKMVAAAAGFGDTAAAQAACQNDTTLGVGYDSLHHTVIVPNRAPMARPASGAWDIGAYQYDSVRARPNPPTELSAEPH